MKTTCLCLLVSTALSSTCMASNLQPQQIDDLEYQHYQVMNDAELAGTKGKAIPLVLIPLLWGAAQGATVNLSVYFAEVAVNGSTPTFKNAVTEAAIGAGLGAISGPMNLSRFLIADTAALFAGGLKGTYLGNGKPKTATPFDSVPTQQDLNKILNDRSWAEQHFKKTLGNDYDKKLQKALDDPSSWKKLTKTTCQQCH